MSIHNRCKEMLLRLSDEWSEGRPQDDNVTFMWSAVGSPPLSVRSARHSLNPESFNRGSKSGGKPTALQGETNEYT